MKQETTQQSAKQYFHTLTSKLTKNYDQLKEKDAYLWACAGLAAGEYAKITAQIQVWTAQTRSTYMTIAWLRLLGVVHWRQQQLPEAVAQFQNAFSVLAKNDWTVRSTATPSQQYFDADLGLDLLWKTLAALAAEKVTSFAVAGTLLGLTREGRLLPHDKDLDIGVLAAQFAAADRVMKAIGWQRTDLYHDFVNFSSYKDPKSKMEIDLCSYATDDVSGKLLGGFWIDGIPWEWQRVLEFPMPISLKQIQTPAGAVWHLSNPDAWLTALYGDWRTPDTEFDTIISARNLRSFSLLVQCFAYSRILLRWLDNDIPRALSLTRQVLRHIPEDHLFLKVEKSFTSALLRVAPNG
ncbi:MAG: hypothetical protein PHF56_11270 [Desulfuromonadaceae bacterium]|nr:hypothetical protein [Desulfuromonadaceae bacterium]